MNIKRAEFNHGLIRHAKGDGTTYSPGKRKSANRDTNKATAKAKAQAAQLASGASAALPNIRMAAAAGPKYLTRKYSLRQRIS